MDNGRAVLLQQRQKEFTSYRDYIGMDITSLVSLPVWIMEPFTILQRLAEIMEYTEHLDTAAHTEDQYERCCSCPWVWFGACDIVSRAHAAASLVGQLPGHRQLSACLADPQPGHLHFVFIAILAWTAGWHGSWVSRWARTDVWNAHGSRSIRCSAKPSRWTWTAASGFSQSRCHSVPR